MGAPPRARTRSPTALRFSWFGLPVLVAACSPGPTTLSDVLADVSAVELRVVEDDGGRPEAVDAVGLQPEVLERLRRTTANREQWAAVFAVAPAASSGAAGNPEAMPGGYVVLEEAVRFLPNTPFDRGKAYRAVFTHGGEALATLEFEPHRAGQASTVRAVAIYPTSDVLPVNLLRFYVEFSAPMRRGEAARNLRLLRAPGWEPVELPVADAEQELWNEERTLFTLLLDPSRAGRGDASGGGKAASPLEVGKRYRLVVERTWRDAEGMPVRDGLDKLFLVDEADRAGGSPEEWTITPPFSRPAPLVVELPRPLDYGLLLHAIEVRARGGATMKGRARISDSETRWTFQPDAGWSSGPYVLRVDAGLQDPSGNAAGGAPGPNGSEEQGERPGTVIPFEVELRPVATGR